MNDDDSVFEEAREANRQWEEQRRRAVIAEGLEGIEYMKLLFPHLAPGLRAYLESRQKTGDFLRAVLENNLREAVGRMDRDQPIEVLRALVELIWNYFPAKSHGSAENVAAWLSEKV